MNARKVCTFAFACAGILLLMRGVPHSAAAEESPVSAADARILAEVRDHSEAMANIEYLSDSIGPRLTGSPQLKQANDWTRDMFQKYGLSNAHLEAWNVARS